MSSILDKITRNLKEGTLIKNGTVAVSRRIYRYFKYANVFYILDKDRILTKKYQQNIPVINGAHFKAGNYYLDPRIPLDQDSVVYSLGILTEISFDLFLSEKYGCEVYMYDPTPVSINFMEQYAANPLLQFRPYGVWTENTTLRFYSPKAGRSASMMLEESDDYFDAECRSMAELMKENNHVKIDLFKADIEGAALPILEQMITQDILPHQIVVEFERPIKDKEAIDDYFLRVTRLRDALKSKGFEEFLLPRKYSKYYSLELLFVNKNEIRI